LANLKSNTNQEKYLFYSSEAEKKKNAAIDSVLYQTTDKFTN
jgi:hypothetical protein